MLTITGSSGFVGQNLINYLAGSYRIDTLSLRYLPGQEVNIFGNAIIHLSGKAHDLRKTSTPKDYYEANFELTRQLYDAFLNSDATKFIYISSVKAVADKVENVLTEDVVANPLTHYGKSKLMAEEYILSKPLPLDKKYYILRPCMIHGLGNKGNLNLLYKFVKKGIPYPLNGFTNKRSFLSVENLCFVIKELLSNDNHIQSGIYNVADDIPLSTTEVVKEIAHVINKRVSFLSVNKNFIKFLADIGTKLNLPFNAEKLDKLTENYIVSNKKIKLAINNELPVSSIEGLHKTILSFQ